MSTPIWDSGDLVASIAAVRCDRCNALASCVQLSTHGDQINVCIRFCFIRAAMAAGLRVEPPPVAALRADRLVIHDALMRELVMTDAERELLNRTWCPTCQSHFCSCSSGKPST